MTINDRFQDLQFTFEVDRWIGVNSEIYCELAWPTNHLKGFTYDFIQTIEYNEILLNLICSNININFLKYVMELGF